MNRKNIVAEYFTFSKIQRRSILVALSLIVVCVVVRFSYSYFVAIETIPADTAFLQQAALLTRPDTSRNQYASRYTSSRYTKDEDEASYREPAEKYTPGKYKPKGELFPFDPNTLDAAGWKRLGLRDKTIGTIQNYLSKGGHFRQPEDIKRIYGLFPDEAERLLPYVRITASASANKSISTTEKTFTKAESPAYKPAIPKTIDINTADTTDFMSLPGIGSKRASQIIKFREGLGGFHSIEQISETYGLPDSVFQKIRPRLTINNTAPIKKININTADANALKSPYIRWNVANAIFQYRQQHGNYTSVNDLKKIALIDEQLFLKIQPYLSVE